MGSHMKSVIFFFIALFSVSGMAALKDVKPVDNTYGWVKPDTDIIYKKNACGGDVYVDGYANRGTYSAIEKTAYDYYYKGGQCTLSKSTLNSTPLTFPQSYDYEDYIKLNPGEDHLTQKHEYTCTLDDSTTYDFEFEIEPAFHCTAEGCYEEAPNCIGDLVARYLDIPGVHSFGHTGMYAGQKVLEIISEEQEIVQLNPMTGFMGKTTYWGSGYNAAQQAEDVDPEIDYAAGVEMVKIGLKQRMFFPEYTLAPIYKEGRFYVKNHRIHYEKGLFRCDTYVKYMYKKVLNTDLPPYNIYQVPFHQWKAFVYKRNPPDNPAKEPTVGSGFQASQQDRVTDILSRDNISDAKKAIELIAQFPKLRTQEDRLRTFDSVSVLYSRESFRFLLEQYQLINDSRTKLRVLSPLRYQYVHYQHDPSFAKLVGEVREIYEHILDKADNPMLLRRAVEDMTIIFGSEQAEHELQAFDPNDKRYRSAYITSMSMAQLNNGHSDDVLALAQTMNGCELTDRLPMFELAYQHDLIAEQQVTTIRDHAASASHDKDCIHQHMLMLESGQ